MIKTTVISGNYNFLITDVSTPNREGNIGTRSFSIGGTYEDCINISYLYCDNEPISAKITTVDYEPECALNMNLEKGGGTVIMLKTLLYHAFKEIPSISLFDFDDMSNIDCIEKDMSKDPPRKSLKPLSLAYLYIANYSYTWYEKNFDARMANDSMYTNYRNEIGFLIDPSKKVDFTFFTDICKMNATTTRLSAHAKAELSKEINNQIDELKPLYESSKTYQEFFHKIPIQHRCKILFPWLDTFMNYYLRRVYNTNNWIIDINSPKMQEFVNTADQDLSGQDLSGQDLSVKNKSEKTTIGGKKKRTTRKKKMRTLIPSNYVIINHKEIHTIDYADDDLRH